MADTSLNENRIGLLIWQTSNVFQSKIRKQLINFNEQNSLKDSFRYKRYIYTFI